MSWPHQEEIIFPRLAPCAPCTLAGSLAFRSRLFGLFSDSCPRCFSLPGRWCGRHAFCARGREEGLSTKQKRSPLALCALCVKFRKDFNTEVTKTTEEKLA